MNGPPAFSYVRPVQQSKPGPPAEGAGVTGGVQVAGSNAYTVCGIGGPFLQGSGTFGVSGVAGTADAFHGPGNGPGGKVTGGGATFGVGGGAAASVQRTNTTVIPLGGHPCPK